MVLCRSLQLGVTGGHADAVGTGCSRKESLNAFRGSRAQMWVTRNEDRVAKLKERVQLGCFVQFRMTHCISFLQVSKALYSHFLQNDIKSATEQLFPKQIALVFLKQFSPFFQTRLPADLTNYFLLPKAAFCFYSYFVYKPPSFSTSSSVPGLRL